jgi:hypothetical protein
MSAEEIAYNAEVLPANRKIADAVLARDPERARNETLSVLAGFTDRITRYAAQRGHEV